MADYFSQIMQQQNQGPVTGQSPVTAPDSRAGRALSAEQELAQAAMAMNVLLDEQMSRTAKRQEAEAKGRSVPQHEWRDTQLNQLLSTAEDRISRADENLSSVQYGNPAPQRATAAPVGPGTYSMTSDAKGDTLPPRMAPQTMSATADLNAIPPTPGPNGEQFSLINPRQANAMMQKVNTDPQAAPAPQAPAVGKPGDQKSRGDIWRTLMEFGLASMAAGGQPGMSTMGAMGAGGLAALKGMDGRRIQGVEQKRLDAKEEREERATAVDERRAGADERRAAAAELNASQDQWQYITDSQDGVMRAVNKRDPSKIVTVTDDKGNAIKVNGKATITMNDAMETARKIAADQSEVTVTDPTTFQTTKQIDDAKYQSVFVKTMEDLGHPLEREAGSPAPVQGATPEAAQAIALIQASGLPEDEKQRRIMAVHQRTKSALTKGGAQ